MQKIQMTTPLVEMDGDEMTRVLWAWIKEKLILPFVDLKTEYYDLGLLHRNETRDQVTIDAANATKRLGVAVKCATITPNRQRMEEYPQLTEMWKSPNGTIRAILDGTAFRAPIVLPMIHPVVKNWEAPITIARHAYGDMYKAVDMVTEEPGTATLTFKGESGAEKTLTVQTVSGPAVWQGQHNTEKSIRAFARSCFQYAISQRQDLWFSTKDTISKVYDGEFKRIFEEEYETTYKAEFEKLGLTYFYTLIDDAVARVIRSKGGFIWALKNYDRHGGHCLRQPCHDDLRAGIPGRHHGVRGVPRHRHPALLQVPEGGEDLHQPHRHHLRLVRRFEAAGRAGRPAGAGAVRPGAGGCLPGDAEGRRDDKRPAGACGARLPGPRRGQRGIFGRDRQAVG